MANNFSSGGQYFNSEQTRLLDAIRYIMTLVKDYNLAQNWDTVQNNSIAYTYYTGVEAGNPSGTATNVKTKEYKKAGKTIFTQTFTYNAADDILTVTVS